MEHIESRLEENASVEVLVVLVPTFVEPRPSPNPKAPLLVALVQEHDVLFRSTRVTPYSGASPTTNDEICTIPRLFGGL